MPVSFSLYLAFEFAFTSKKLERKLTEIQELSTEKQQILAIQNEVLEAQVTERTAELELKNRELVVEAALEKVRGRTMAMHKSDELSEVATLLFQQMSQLGSIVDRFSIGIFNEPKGIVEIWATGQSGNLLENRFVARLDEKTTVKKVYDGWKAGLQTHIVDVQGEELREWIRYAREEMGILVNEAQLRGRGLNHLAYFSHGYIVLQSHEPLAQNLFSILQRFATVFNLTYTRFLDLQKAEKQAREAQIEAALENVRARSLAMQKSTELRNVVSTVVERMIEIGLNIASANIVLFGEHSKDLVIWTKTNKDDFYSKGFSLPYNDDPAMADYFDAFGRRANLFTKSYTFEEKNAFWKVLFERSDFRHVPAERKKFILEAAHFSTSVVCRKNTAIQLTRYVKEPFSETDNQILKRFATIFEQAYTRFLDLQKAEAQALDVLRRTTVDRVRAEIASMRTTGDLERITPLIWNELTTLGVPFIRCGVFIMDEEQQQIHTFLSSPDGKAIASFNTPFSNPGLLTEALPHWRNKEIYKTHWDEATFLAQAQTLFGQGAISSTESYLTENRPTSLYLHLLPFLQGMLYVGSDTAPLTNDQLSLVQTLADAFSTAYARYEDFNKLGVAKQQVETAFSELKATQAQLIQKEKMASLGELTAGIAHEIQNPLNFVNNFSEVSAELVTELEEEQQKADRDTELEAELLGDLKQNLQKIAHHGSRASSIVKGMLEHSRTSTGERQSTDLNALADEYLRLAYQGLRAKDKSFNATLKTDFAADLSNVEVVPQEIGRVLLNLFNNAFYAVREKQKSASADYQPTVTVSTRQTYNQVEIIVKDNGTGVPEAVKAKIFQPFFTTKPTGEGTGLGLSLSYDIVTKGHNGTLTVESEQGEGTKFVISIPAQKTEQLLNLR